MIGDRKVLAGLEEYFLQVVNICSESYNSSIRQSITFVSKVKEFMQFREYKPTSALQKYVLCYYEIVCEEGVVIEDKAFATGCVEVMMTLNGTPWQTKIKDNFTVTSTIELWGQIIKPLDFRSTGSCEIFGIRFHPAAAAFLLREEIHRLNDGVFDLVAILGKSVEELHARLQEACSIRERIDITDTYLQKRLIFDSKSLRRIDLIRQVMNDLTRKDLSENITDTARRYGISSRYLQEIFLSCTGLTPKLYSQINRFQNSLVLLGKGNKSLTAIAYDCGYFDQSHFIREFKSFTGYAPSGFDPENSSAILASPNKVF